MTNATLHEHQARVDRAEKTLSADLQRLALWSRRFKRRMGKRSTFALIGGAALFGIIAVGAAARRRARVARYMVDDARTPSLLGTAARVAMLELMRLASVRLAEKLMAALTRTSTPRLVGQTAGDTRSMRKHDE